MSDKVTASHLSRTAVIYLLQAPTRGFSARADGFWCAGLRSLLMTGQDEPRDMAALVVPQAGWLERAEDPWEPYRLRDPAGSLVGPVAAFLRDLQASGRPETTLRAYGTALLRCCAGSGSCGRPGCRGIRRPAPRPGTSAAGSRSPSSPAARAMRPRRVFGPALPRPGPRSSIR